MNEDSTKLELRPSIRMGEMDVVRHRGILRTLLGSCIGLALYDGRYQIAGLAHIVLPTARGVTDLPGKFVDTAIPGLLQEMKGLAGASVRPVAKIAGGAKNVPDGFEPYGRRPEH